MLATGLQECIEYGNGTDERRRYIAPGPISFDAWLEFATDNDTELVRGVVVEKMVASFPHENLFAWLISIMRGYVTHKKLGTVLGSRTAVKIRNMDARLPDILFVGAEKTHIIHQNAILGTPDLVVEIVSPNDRQTELIALEADYMDLGVPEIVFIDPGKRRVRLVQKASEGYEASFITEGSLNFASVTGFEIQVEWLFMENRQDEYTVLKTLIEKKIR